jgi:hypothetical protein
MNRSHPGEKSSEERLAQSRKAAKFPESTTPIPFFLCVFAPLREKLIILPPHLPSPRASAVQNSPKNQEKGTANPANPANP